MTPPPDKHTLVAQKDGQDVDEANGLGAEMNSKPNLTNSGESTYEPPQNDTIAQAEEIEPSSALSLRRSE